MREILFRGKTTDRGEWVQGCYTETLKYNNLHWIWDGKNHFTVKPETVGQYTGLTDKNGKKIFEGDIVKVFLKDGVEIGYIRYRDAGCRFQFMGEYSIGYNIDNTTEFEVIGNIHDNPELLGCGE